MEDLEGIFMSGKKTGFTLIELLVVISIIALLLSILMPALNKAKEVTRAVVCQDHVKIFSFGNMMYANDSDEMLVPPHWLANKHFLLLLGLDREQAAINVQWAGNAWYEALFTEDHICPSSRIARFGHEVGSMGGFFSLPNGFGSTYAYNAGAHDNLDGYEWWQEEEFYKMPKIGQASEKVMFLDSSDAITNTPGAHTAYLDCGVNYERHWDMAPDVFGQGIDGVYHTGAASYRHNEGASIGFFDGHAGRMHKTELWVLMGSPETSDNPTMRRLWKLPK